MSASDTNVSEPDPLQEEAARSRRPCGNPRNSISQTDSGITSPMGIGEHLRFTGGALKGWLFAQCQDSVAVGVLWLLGLYAIGVPWAILWAMLAAVLQFVPHLGPVLSLIGPVLVATLHWQDWQHPLYVMSLYAAIVVIDGFLLQPYLMKRTAKVPIWASILGPIALGLLIPFWGVLLAPPLLAVVYAYKRRAQDVTVKDG